MGKMALVGTLADFCMQRCQIWRVEGGIDGTGSSFINPFRWGVSIIDVMRS